MMSALKLSEIAKETGGEIVGEATVLGVSTDTRQIRRGDLFVALVGDRFDGNEFVAAAVTDGAVAAIVTAGQSVTVPHIRVQDTRLALGLVARLNRRQFHGPLLALTGSAGKTTCKEMIASILRQCGQVLATEANFNNEIGVPQTLLKIGPEHQYAVVEMGASRRNDIRYLTQFAEPTIALLTNAMPAHIEGFGSLQEVANTKGQILESVSAGGIAVINLDDRFFEQWKQQAGSARVLTFSLQNQQADFYSRDIEIASQGATQFILCTPAGEITVQLALLGVHNVMNAIAASAATFAAGAELEAIRNGLESVRPVKGRLQVLQSAKQTIIDDSYNANPGSVRAAIDLLAEFKGSRCLILGAMAELGEAAGEEHDAVAAYARDKRIDRLILVGPHAQHAAQIFGEAFTDRDSLLQSLAAGLDADVVLVKGSRSSAMEKVVEALTKNLKQESC